jgi:hypothetical protein
VTTKKQIKSIRLPNMKVQENLVMSLIQAIGVRRHTKRPATTNLSTSIPVNCPVIVVDDSTMKAMKAIEKEY